MSKRILAIGTHPDDIEIGCGGTLARLHDNGYQLTFIIATSGEEGMKDLPKEHIQNIREDEALSSGRYLGASEIIFLREPDGLTSFSKDTKIRLISIIRDIKPDIVFTHAKSDRFPDHTHVHALTMAAVQAAQGPWYPQASGSPFRVKTIFGYEVWNPINEIGIAYDITDSIEKKIEALRFHKSQIHEINYLSAIRGLAAYRGAMTQTGHFAEAFEILKLGNIQ